MGWGLDHHRGRSHTALYLVAIVLPVAITLAGARLAMPAFVFEHIMVLVVVVLAVAGGRGPAIATAIAGVIGDNVLLREPVGRPAITGYREAIDLGLFLAVAIVVGWLVDRVRVAGARAMDALDRERRAREDLDRLIATLTHDLATPLSAIQGTIQFTRRHHGLSDLDVSRLLARVETAAARATSLVKALTDARSIEQHSLSLERRLIDVREVVEPIVGMLDRTSDRHPIVFAAQAGALLVHADVDRLGRVVENLIANAIKYSPGGGAVEVCVEADEGMAGISVRDHGIGVSPDVRDRVFDLGFRAPDAARVAPGLGLGLYTAAEVVRRHGGTIAVAAADGGGSVFTIRLPLARHGAVLPGVESMPEAGDVGSRLVH